MKKRRKKKGGRRLLVAGLTFLCRPSPPSHSRPHSSYPLLLSSSSSLSCLHCCTCDLDLPHESSTLCFDILAHSCCDVEVHVEELQAPFPRLSTRAAQYHGPYLQVSPLIPHRQGFRPH